MTFNNKTIEDLHNLLVSKEISATELTKQHLKISSLARQLSTLLSPSLKSKPLLKLKPLMKLESMLTMSFQGIPLAVKDNISTDGILYNCCLKNALQLRAYL